MCSNNYDIKTICRICLNTEKNLINIFSSTSDISSINIAIMECAPISISEEDRLPHKICTCCLDKLKIAYNFKILCIDSDRILYNNTSNTVIVNDGDNEKLEIIPIIGLPTTFNKSTEKYEEEKNSYEESLSDNSSILLKNENEDIVSFKTHDTNKITHIFKETNVKNRSKPISAYQLKRRKQKSTMLALISHADNYFYCTICHKKYKTKEALKEHLIIHSDFRYRCNECDKQFNHRLKLTRHRYKHESERKYNCEICGLLCYSLEYLRQHQLIHTNRREHKCDMCDKEFTLKRYLDKHLIIHQDERLYVCETCGKSFKRSDHLTCHSQIHNKKRFQCVNCPQSFVSKQNLQQHIARRCYSL